MGQLEKICRHQRKERLRISKITTFESGILSERRYRSAKLWKFTDVCFYFILLDSPIIGRVTATAWRQLLRARNSPSPHERKTTTPGTTSPTLYEQCVGSLTSHRIYICKGCETGPTVYRPYPRRLESLTVCRCLYKGSTFSSVI